MPIHVIGRCYPRRVRADVLLTELPVGHSGRELAPFPLVRAPLTLWRDVGKSRLVIIDLDEEGVLASTMYSAHDPESSKPVSRARRWLLSAAGVAIILILLPVSPAVAIESEVPIDIYDATALIHEVSPHLMRETYTPSDGAARIHTPRSSSPPRVIIVAPAPVDDARGQAGTGENDVHASPPLGVTPSYVTTQRSQASGITVWETASPAVAAYIQPLSMGARILTAIADRSAPTTYEYELAVPAGTALRQNSLGYMIIGPTGESLGQLLAPWALDSAGRKLPTHYEWNDGILIQHVDLQHADITFPVLIDPAWTYTHSVRLPRKTVPEVRANLIDCFSCYFPVEGAPAAFPNPDQYLPLVVRPWIGSPIVWDFSCYFNYSYYENYGGGDAYFGWSFRASSTHVDGLGSGIGFDFVPYWPIDNPSWKRAQLVVSAYIVNDDPVGLGQPAYVMAATSTWNQFAFMLDP